MSVQDTPAAYYFHSILFFAGKNLTTKILTPFVPFSNAGFPVTYS